MSHTIIAVQINSYETFFFADEDVVELRRPEMFSFWRLFIIWNALLFEPGIWCNYPLLTIQLGHCVQLEPYRRFSDTFPFFSQVSSSPDLLARVYVNEFPGEFDRLMWPCSVQVFSSFFMYFFLLCYRLPNRNLSMAHQEMNAHFFTFFGSLNSQISRLQQNQMLPSFLPVNSPLHRPIPSSHSSC